MTNLIKIPLRIEGTGPTPETVAEDTALATRSHSTWTPPSLTVTELPVHNGQTDFVVESGLGTGLFLS